MLGNKGRGPRRVAGFLLVAATSALLFAWFAGVASASKRTPVDPATLEVCKIGTGTNGMTWTFTLKRGLNTVGTVDATGNGGCVQIASGLVSSNANGPINYKLTETPTANVQGTWSMSAAAPDPSSPGTVATLNASRQIVIVNVVPGENIVNITNSQAASSLKICKTTSDAASNLHPYSFTVNGVPGYQAIANGACTDLIAAQQGERVTVVEQTPSNQVVQSVTSQDSTHPTIISVNGSTVKAKIGAGVNVLTFDNEPVGPPQQGNLEICKVALDPFINQIASFHYTIQDGNQTFTADVAPGQCSGPINGMFTGTGSGGIPAGTVTVTETIPDNANWQLKSVTLEPNSAGSVGLVIPANGSAQVVVPVYTAGDVAVDFNNVSNLSTVKVCKFLSAGSGQLAGQTFNFYVTDSQILNNAGNPVRIPVSIIASPPGTSGACAFVMRNGTELQVPVGSTIQATEVNSDSFIDAGNGAGNNFTTQPQTVTAGVNELDVTNTALGQLEFCKYMTGNDSGLGQTFSFTYSGPVSGTATTTANNCSFPAVVPAGTYTVTEDMSKLMVTMGDGTKVPAFQFVASDARGPLGDPRCVPAQSYPAPDNTSIPPPPPPGNGCGLTFQVTVPYFGMHQENGETLVSFWNRQVRANVKVCKVVDPHSLGSLANYTWTYTIQTTSGDSFTTRAIGNGTCTGLIGNFPVALPKGSGGCTANLCPNVVTVTENGASAANPNWLVQSISVTGGYDVCFGPGCNGDISTGVVNYHTGPGTNAVTYTNRATPLGP